MAVHYVETLTKGEGPAGDVVTLTDVSTNFADIITATSGDLIVTQGGLVGVCVTDYDSTLDELTVALTGGWELSVVAANDSGNSAVKPGDWLYYDKANSRVSKESSGNQAIGQALEAITAGSTATINVVLRPQAP